MSSKPKYNIIKYDGNLFNIKNNLRKNSDTAYYSLTNVPEGSVSDNKIFDMIDDDSIIIDDIWRVNNPFLMRAYQLKKEQKKHLFGRVEEKLYFHGTEEGSIDNICKFNFNWRLNGQNGKHQHGQGVYFTSSAKFATKYSGSSRDRVMVVAKVLVVESCVGRSDMVLPDEGCDTSTNRNGTIIVKYEDHEFYPEFLVDYHIKRRFRH